MNITLVHQAVHGYARGHIELGASVKLGHNDSALVTRLSDLSGALVEDEPFDSYLTFYPLPSQEYYAVGKTWIDHDAPRAGCVLTHTLLVPMKAWMHAPNLYGLSKALRKPGREELVTYETPISEVPPLSPPALPLHPDLTAFCNKLFGEGLTPLVWFEAREAELLVWRLLNCVWANLRKQLSICTYALKPRALDDRPFDVLFAPEKAVSRFTQYAQDHTLQSQRGHPGYEAWIHEWTSLVFSDDPQPNRSGARRLAARLESHPPAIRRVFLFFDLLNRANATPVAAIGALDVLGTLRLPPDLHRPQAERLIALALNAASGAMSRSVLNEVRRRLRICMLRDPACAVH